MNARWTTLWILLSLLSSVYAEPQAVSVSSTSTSKVPVSSDGFDLPDDIEETEIIRFTPIEATETTAPQIQSSSSLQIVTSLNAPTANEAPIKFEERSVPQELSRPIRVGVFVGEKQVYLKYAGDIIKVTAHGKNIKLEGKSNSIEMESREFANEDGSCMAFANDMQSLAHACYAGSVLFRANNGKVDAINSVDVEDYLRGVVPYEIGKLDSSRIEALKAQAVAARTYAYRHYNSRESQGFDVYADTKDQVYKGLEGSTPLTDAAVKSTAGVTMMYNGEFIIAYYHSTCGGTTESLATWNRDDVPYLQSKPDLKKDGTPFCNESSYMKWERKFSDSEIAGLIKKNLDESKAKLASADTKNFKKVKDILVKDKLKSGRILTLVVKTDRGNIEVLTDRTRWLFKKAGAILPSSLFSIAHTNKEWVITGSGFGHGVGMCQMGVRARAKDGQNYQEILTHYYPGITLEKFER